MPANRCKPIAARCRARAATLITASLLLAVLGACDTTPPPGQPADPGQIARQVIADFLSLPVAEVTLVSLEARDFNDSSLGCPEPGMSYQQVITAGHRAVIEADGRRFDVRVAGTHGRICRNSKRKPQEFSPGRKGAGRESAITAMANRARIDLAARLDAAPPDVRLLDAAPWDGRTAPAGCVPQCPATGHPAGKNPTGEPSCGWLIGLYYDGRRYDYHAAGDTVVPCPAISRS